MNYNNASKYLGLYETDVEDYQVGGFDKGANEDDLYDDNYKRFLKNKYGEIPAGYDVGGFDKLGFKSQNASDKEEYELSRRDYDNVASVVHRIGNTHPGLTFSTQGLLYDKEVGCSSILNNFSSPEEVFERHKLVKQEYQKGLGNIAFGYGCRPDDLQEWIDRSNKGFIHGTVRTVRDMLNVYRDVAPAAAGTIAATTAAGAAIGSAVPGVGTAAGALAGLRTGGVAINRAEVPVAVFSDTFKRELGSSIDSYLTQHPDATMKDLESLKTWAVRSAVVSAAFEAGMSEVFAGYTGKAFLMIPGVKKLAKPTLQKAMKELPKHFTAAQWGAFAAEVSKITGMEVGTEEIQGLFSSYCDQMVSENKIINLENDMRQEGLSPEEKDKIEFQLNRERQIKEDSKFTWGKAGETAWETVQGVGLLALFGGGVHAKSMTYQSMADSINAKLEEADRAAGIEPEVKTNQQETPTLKGGVEENVYVDMNASQLSKEEAKTSMAIKEKENLIATTQERIDRAEELGIDESEKIALEEDLFKLKKEKDSQVDQMKLIGTEKAIKQATEQTEADLEATNSKIEKTNSDIENVESKIEAAKKAGKSTTKLEARAKKLDETLNKLEAKQEQLLSDKTKLEKREDVESVLKGKKTKIGSNVLTNIEKRAEEAIAKSDAKAVAKINKIRENAVIAKVKALAKSIREQQNQYVKGYTTGAKEQITETKDIRKTLYRVLREQGIHRKELYKFDTITKDITTLQDLEASQKRLIKKIREVYEERNKAAALKKTEQLMKLAKPFKAGKTPKGKMTADIQNKVNRLFSFVPRSLYDIGFEIQELMSRFSENPDAKLKSEEQVEIAIGTNDARIVANQERINELKNDKEKNKTKWQGAKKNREDALKGESVDSAVSRVEMEIPEALKGSELLPTMKKNLNDRIASVLNIMNMKLSFKNLNISIRKSIFSKELVVSAKGAGAEFDEKTNIITVFADAKNTLVHEMGHYYDKLLAEAIGYKNVTFSELMNIKDPALKPIMQKFGVLLKAERARIKNMQGFLKNVSEDQRDYFLSNKEIFARIFNALFNKINNEHMEKPEGVGKIGSFLYDVTETVSAKTLSDFESVLNDLAKYKEVGLSIHELNQVNENLEAQNEQIRKIGAKAMSAEMRNALPETIAELVYELEIAADLKHKTAAEIMEFNDYVEGLIREGRDARQQKLEAQKERREQEIAVLRSNIKKYAPKMNTLQGKIFNKLATLYTAAGANWYSMLNLFFGKEVADKYSIIKNEAERNAFIREEKHKFHEKVAEIYGFKHDYEVGQMTHDYLAQTEKFVVHGKRGDRTVTYHRLQALAAWIYYQNDVGRARLENMMDEGELNRLFSMLSEEDRQLADVMINTTESYYDRVNAIFREDRGLDLPRRERYFPFAIDSEILDIPTFMDASFGTVNGLPSFTKTVTESKNIKLELGNPISTLMNHIDNVADYINTYTATKEIAALFKDDDVVKDMDEAFGVVNGKAFRGMINNITMGGRLKYKNELQNKVSKFLDGLAANYIVSKIAFKPTIGLKQLLSHVNYAEDIPVSQFIKYEMEFFKHPKESIKFMMNDKYLQARFREGTEVFDTAQVLETSEFSKTGLFKDWLTLNVRLGDMGAIVLGGYAQVKYLMNEKGMSKEKAFEEFRISTANSQQFSSSSSLSLLQNMGKDNPIARMLFAFKNTPYQYHRKLVDALVQVSRGEITKKQYAKTVAIYQVINPLLYNWSTSLSALSLLLAYATGDDDDKKKAKEEFMLDSAEAIVTGNSNLIPFIDDLPVDFFKKVTGQKAYPVQPIPFGREFDRVFISDGPDIIRAAASADFDDIKLEDFLKVVEDAGAIFAGLPLKYARSAGEGIGKLMDEEERLEGMLRIIGYTPSRAKETAKYAK